MNFVTFTCSTFLILNKVVSETDATDVDFLRINFTKSEYF